MIGACCVLCVRAWRAAPRVQTRNSGMPQQVFRSYSTVVIKHGQSVSMAVDALHVCIPHCYLAAEALFPISSIHLSGLLRFRLGARVSYIGQPSVEGGFPLANVPNYYSDIIRVGAKKFAYSRRSDLPEASGRTRH